MLNWLLYPRNVLCNQEQAYHSSFIPLYSSDTKTTLSSFKCVCFASQYEDSWKNELAQLTAQPSLYELPVNHAVKHLEQTDWLNVCLFMCVVLCHRLCNCVWMRRIVFPFMSCPINVALHNNDIIIIFC